MATWWFIIIIIIMELVESCCTVTVDRGVRHGCDFFSRRRFIERYLFLFTPIMIIKYVQIYSGESIDRKSYVQTVCDVTERELRSVECSKQAKCDVPHRCHKQIYYTCYYPVWHVRYKLGPQVHDATIHHEHTVYGNTQEADSVLNAVSSSKTCYADTRNPSKCQWTRPNSAPFFIFMIFTASLLGILCCCLAVDRLCNLDSPRRFVAVPSVLFSSSDDPFGNKYDADEEKRFPTSTKTNKYGSLSRAYV
jgi:hypothetical protein